MIFVLAGTADGRELVERLLVAGYAVTASVVSRYGAELLAADSGGKLTVNDEPLDEAALAVYCKAHGIRILIDASHPYAVNVSQNAMDVAAQLGIPYLRYERSLTELDYDQIYIVHSYEEAAEQAASLGQNIFLTTGSHNLERFTQATSCQNKNIVARVLPTPAVVAHCAELGLSPAQIVALQGPFSTALNRELFRRYQAEVIVTKNSGEVGGTDTKLLAAKELNLPVVIIDRPPLHYPQMARTYAEVLDFVQKEASHGFH